MNPFTLLLLGMTGLLFCSPNLLAQTADARVAEALRAGEPETVDQRIQRLQYRYEIKDIDGISELIAPLWTQVVSGDANLGTPQKHLIAMASLKYHLATGDHGRAIVPYLVALHQQTELEENPRGSLVDFVDGSFRDQYLPPVFFSDEDPSRFRIQFKHAIDGGACLEDEHSAYYAKASSNQLSTVQKQTVDMISAVKEDPQPRDRELLKLIEHYLSHRAQHSTLAHESLATAIEGLKRLERDAEADRLTSVFQTQFPNSRRLDR